MHITPGLEKQFVWMTNVKPTFIGTRLLNEIINLAKNVQCKKVRWQVSDWNVNAIEFYKKLGAKIDGTENKCDLLIE